MTAVGMRLETRVGCAVALAVWLSGLLAAGVVAHQETVARVHARDAVALADGDARRSRAESVEARRALTVALGHEVLAASDDGRAVLTRAVGAAGMTTVQIVTRDGTVIQSAGVHRAGQCPLVAETELGGGRRIMATFAQGCPTSPTAALDVATPAVGWMGWPTVLVLALGAAVIAGAVAWLLARPVARVLVLLATATVRVGHGDFSVRVRPRGDDALADLVQSFNQMVEALALSRERIDYLQRLAGWQEVARRLAHEIKNPLTPIQLAVQEVARKCPDDNPKYKRLMETALEVVEEEVATLRRLVGAFSEFARLPEVKTAPADLGDFVRDAAASRAFLDEAAGTLRQAEVTVEFHPGEGPLPVAIDRMMLRRALDNLVRNAVQALEASQNPEGTPATGRVWVRAERRRTDRDPGDTLDQAWLVVEDNGPGIPAAAQARVFDPYFTTRAEGTGLGLAIVRKIALDHDGDVGLEDRPGGGTRFVITLPLRDPGRAGRLSFVTFSTRRAPDAPSPLPTRSPSPGGDASTG